MWASSRTHFGHVEAHGSNPQNSQGVLLTKVSLHHHPPLVLLTFWYGPLLFIKNFRQAIGPTNVDCDLNVSMRHIIKPCRTESYSLLLSTDLIFRTHYVPMWKVNYHVVPLKSTLSFLSSKQSDHKFPHIYHSTYSVV